MLSKYECLCGILWQNLVHFIFSQHGKNVGTLDMDLLYVSLNELRMKTKYFKMTMAHRVKKFVV